MPHVFVGVPQGGERLDDGSQPKTLQAQIERLIQEGHLGRYVLRGNERDHADPRASRAGREVTRPKEGQRERSRLRQRTDTWHHGTIATISGGKRCTGQGGFNQEEEGMGGASHTCESRHHALPGHHL
ncbi:hypothetical protein CR513_53444, partial [Mucuna pruriens]